MTWQIVAKRSSTARAYEHERSAAAALSLSSMCTGHTLVFHDHACLHGRKG